ncbi:hemicentin-1-like [Mytilus californianus]|uniref:hemicentin-1-like n=1 Tax=Mytilus californianus TaxID=6549 RepID=UPI002247EE58|nr:hemicentin-1-like [Mytilus californianus]
MHVTTSESAKFTCFAENDVGTAKSNSVDVNVNGGLPVVVAGVQSYNTTYGKKIQLDCSFVAHSDVLLVYWQKNYKNVITTIYKGAVGTAGITHTFPSLVLTRPTTADSGIYTCFATNVAGTQKSLPTTLIVEGGRPIINITSTRYTAFYGKEITLKCIVFSNPLLTSVFWHKINNHGQVKLIKNGEPGTSGSSVQIPSLTIKFATPADEEIHFCLAENNAGLADSRPIKLNVHAGNPLQVYIYLKYEY